MKAHTLIALLVLAAFSVSNASALNASEKITPQAAEEIAKEAYIFGFPFVANYRVFITRLLEKDPLMQGVDFNQFAHNKELFPP